MTKNILKPKYKSKLPKKMFVIIISFFELTTISTGFMIIKFQYNLKKIYIFLITLLLTNCEFIVNASREHT